MRRLFVVTMDPLGRPFQQRSVEELVKQELRLEHDDHPPKRGCGCAALLGPIALVLLVLAVKVSHGAGGEMDLTTTLLATVVPLALMVAVMLLSVRLVSPGERLVVYRLGKTNRDLIRGYVAARLGPRSRFRRELTFIIPVVDRTARVHGDLVEAWDTLREATPESWWVWRPSEDARRGMWTVRTEGPGGARVESAGHTQTEALDDLARRLRALSARAHR